jgi:hypothetical protein
MFLIYLQHNTVIFKYIFIQNHIRFSLLQMLTMLKFAGGQFGTDLWQEIEKLIEKNRNLTKKNWGETFPFCTATLIFILFVSE